MSKAYLETIKALNGELFHLQYHQERLNKALDISSNKPHSLKDILSPPPFGLYRCRVVYDHENISVEYIPYVKRRVERLKIIYNDEITYEKKYADRKLIDTLFTLRGECDDILMVKSGLIRDTSIANIAFFDGDKWITPKRPLLEGTTRARYLNEKKIIAQDIFVDDLASFSKVALLNAMIDFDIIASENIGEIIC
ncbi:MAG: aminotransferase class IV [Campylobacterales bacterium]|nr:aminotransferase class IV [Campylobacterales bacterium]